MPCWPCPPTGCPGSARRTNWQPRSHNAYKQFHALVRQMTARYDVPTFLNTAWLEGLTAEGVVHQRGSSTSPRAATSGRPTACPCP